MLKQIFEVNFRLVIITEPLVSKHMGKNCSGSLQIQAPVIVTNALLCAFNGFSIFGGLQVVLSSGLLIKHRLVNGEWSMKTLSKHGEVSRAMKSDCRELMYMVNLTKMTNSEFHSCKYVRNGKRVIFI